MMRRGCEKKRVGLMVLSLVVVSLFFFVPDFHQRLASAGEVIHWKGQNNYPGVQPGINADNWIKWIERASGGRLKIELFPAPGVVPVGESFNAVSKGVLDIVATYGAFNAKFVPEAIIETGLPFAWQAPWEMWDAYYRYGLVEVMQENYAKHNVFWLPQIMGGRRHLATTFPCDTPDALKGKKIRAVGVDAKYVSLLGASPAMIPGTELYTALKLGTVDGCIYGMGALSIMADVWKYYVVSPNYGGLTGAYIINQDSLNKLPDDLKALFTRDSRYVILGGALDADVAEAKIVRKALKEHDFKLISWSEKDTLRVVEMAQTIWDEQAKISPAAARMIEIIKTQAADYGRLR